MQTLTRNKGTNTNLGNTPRSLDCNIDGMQMRRSPSLLHPSHKRPIESKHFLAIHWLSKTLESVESLHESIQMQIIRWKWHRNKFKRIKPFFYCSSTWPNPAELWHSCGWTIPMLFRNESHHQCNFQVDTTAWVFPLLPILVGQFPQPR